MTDEVMPVETKPEQRRRFGVKHLLLLTVVVATAVVAWRVFFYQHPAWANSLYEKAPYTQSGQFKAGPIRISIKSVSRSDRNETLIVEDGFGEASSAPVPNADVLANSGAWLDSAQVEFAARGGTFEVLDVRVFDFETRQVIDKVERQSGHRMVGPQTLQIFRLGEKLPDTVDVFLRVLVHGPGNTPTRLMPGLGATCELPGGTLKITNLVEGFRSYSAATGVVGDPESSAHETSVMLTFDGRWPDDAKYMISAVKKDGTRATRERYIRFPGSYVDPNGNRAELVSLSAGLHDIQHLEMRPLDGNHRFFFEGVQLPRTSTAGFGNPPGPIVQLNGVEEVVPVPELAPLDVSVQVLKGDAVSGTLGNENGIHISLRVSGPKNPETKTTIVDRMQGLSTANSELIVQPVSVQGGSSYGGGRFLRHGVVDAPIEDIHSVQIQFPNP